MAGSDADSDGLFALAEDAIPNDEHYGGFLQSLHRIKKLHERQKHDTVQKLLQEGRKDVDVRASEIYLRKESAAARQSRRKEPLQTGAELDQTISYLQQCSINLAGVQHALQQSAVNAQVQENFQQLLQAADEEDTNNELVNALDASHPALSVAAAVAKRVAAVEAKKQLRRQRRVELAALHRSVNDLWQQKEQRDLTKKKRTDSELLKRKREKLSYCEEKLDIIVHLLQALYTGVSPQWGSNSRYLDVLKACELYNTSRQATDWDEISSLLAFFQSRPEDSSD